MPEQDLLKFKKAIEEAKTQESVKIGERYQLIKTLQEDFNCKDVAEAKKYLTEIEDTIKEKQTILITGVNNLKKELRW